MPCEVVEKEFPFLHLPKTRHFMFVEADHESSDEIEFSSELGERPKRFNSLDYAMDTEKSRNFAEHGQPVYIETKSGMTEQLRNRSEERRVGKEGRTKRR